MSFTTTLQTLLEYTAGISLLLLICYWTRKENAKTFLSELEAAFSIANSHLTHDEYQQRKFLFDLDKPTLKKVMRSIRPLSDKWWFTKTQLDNYNLSNNPKQLACR